MPRPRLPHFTASACLSNAAACEPCTLHLCDTVGLC